jgi:FAD-dependent oxidoreductase domain-containing protein 1
MDPHSVLMGFRRKATSLGIIYVKDRVVDFEVAGKRVAAVRLESGGSRVPTDDILARAGAC